MELTKVEELIGEESVRRQQEKVDQRMADRGAIIDGVAAKVKESEEVVTAKVKD